MSFGPGNNRNAVPIKSFSIWNNRLTNENTPKAGPYHQGLQQQPTYFYFCIMTLITQIKETIKSIKPLLADKYHVSSIGLFGSVVRSDFSAGRSDIDIIVDFSKPVGIEFIDLADFLENVLDKKVDLVSRNGIKDKYFAQIEREIEYV